VTYLKSTASPGRLHRKARHMLEVVLLSSPVHVLCGVVQSAREHRRRDQVDNDLIAGELP
jgi:hypothetical protein